MLMTSVLSSWLEMVARFETDLQVVKLDRDGDPLDVMPQGQVGEVLGCGESKTIGYFKEVALTETAFHARLPDGTRPTTHYLRTGDLVSFRRRTGSSSLWPAERHDHPRWKEPLLRRP